MIIPKRFSKRQLEVIESWGRCSDPALVANELQLSVHTVQTHLKRLRKKLGVRKTAQVLRFLEQSSEAGSAGMGPERKNSLLGT